MIFSDYSLVLLIHGGELSNTNTYQDVMRAAFGRPGFIVLTIMQFLYPMIGKQFDTLHAYVRMYGFISIYWMDV